MSRTLADHATHHTTQQATQHSTQQATHGPSLRLTGRGRLVVLVALTVAVFALISVGRVWAQADAGAPAGATSSTWVVQPGETLWTVAGAVAPDVDPRETIARIVDLNGLPDTAVVAGQTLLVPA